MKVRIMVLHMGAEFEFQQKSGSGDMGSDGVQNGVFRESLKKYMLYLADFRAERN